jgi:lipopolysaccharide transport system permease protein
MYPASALPEGIRPWLYLNPVSFIVEQVREVLIFGHPPAWQGLGWYALAALAVAWAGFWLFQRARRGFADVL